MLLTSRKTGGMVYDMKGTKIMRLFRTLTR
jgi:hypothetical protein